MTNESLFINGWGTCKSVWQPLIEELQLSADFLSPSELYLNGQFIPPEIKESKLIVAWSMGAMLALESQLEADTKLVIIASSPHFCHPDYGWPTRVVERMIKQLSRKPETVLKQFLATVCQRLEQSPRFMEQNSYSKLLEDGWTDQSLLAGLRYLQESNLIERLQALKNPTLWIHGDSDKICPINALELLPADIEILTLADTGHLPFWQDSTLIAKVISEFKNN